METDIKLTKLASCAGCGAKVGAGTLVQLLEGFRTHSDPRLLVGYDRSDDASVYYLDENTALVQTTDFFPPIVDDPFLYGQIAAANAISDVYAMGGEPKLALNILCLPESMPREMVQELLRGGYDKAYEAGAIITGGHTIHGAEPIYGLAVSGFVHPKKILTNSGARPGDVLLLTKPLGVGVLTTTAKAGLADEAVMDRAARMFEGTHDFAAVRSVGTNVRSTVRTIYYCRVTRNGELLELKVCANGFLYNMVRAITGTVLYAAEGKLAPEDIPVILDSGNRTLAGPTAPPGGLYLTRVWYEDERLNG